MPIRWPTGSTDTPQQRDRTCRAASLQNYAFFIPRFHFELIARFMFHNRLITSLNAFTLIPICPTFIKYVCSNRSFSASQLVQSWTIPNWLAVDDTISSPLSSLTTWSTLEAIRRDAVSRSSRIWQDSIIFYLGTSWSKAYSYLQYPGYRTPPTNFRRLWSQLFNHPLVSPSHHTLGSGCVSWSTLTLLRRRGLGRLLSLKWLTEF